MILNWSSAFLSYGCFVMICLKCRPNTVSAEVIHKKDCLRMHVQEKEKKFFEGVNGFPSNLWFEEYNATGKERCWSQRSSKTAMCFQSQFVGPPPDPPTLNSQTLQKIIYCVFPRLAGNDLTTTRKRNVKHSLELFVTSEHWVGPYASASQNIPENTQLKLPTAGVNCCLAPTQNNTESTQAPASLWSVCEGIIFTSGPLVRTIKSIREVLRTLHFHWKTHCNYVNWERLLGAWFICFESKRFNLHVLAFVRQYASSTSCCFVLRIVSQLCNV